MAIVHLVPGSERSYVELLEQDDPYEVPVDGWRWKLPAPKLGDWVIGILIPEQLIHAHDDTLIEPTGEEHREYWRGRGEDNDADKPEHVVVQESLQIGTQEASRVGVALSGGLINEYRRAA